MISPSSRNYPHYVLGVLVLVYVFNFIDRQILSILAEDIRADLGLTDSQLGFLYGTAFAVFYAIFGIPLGRLADNWDRRKLISIGLGFWSLMTALSGTARSFLALGLYRIGVGIGEASATPAALSLLADYYSQHVRATVMAIYYSGIYLGAGLGLVIGGLTVDQWEAVWPDPATAPLGLRGWQVAYLAVGLPGLLLALWVRTLREPKRGVQEGIETAPVSANPFRNAFREFLAILPIASWWSMLEAGCTRRDYQVNVAALIGIALAAWLLIGWTGDVAQWLALGVGVYVSLCWMQTNRLRDPVGFGLMFRTPSYTLSLFAFAALAFVTYGLGFWTPPFFQRVHGLSPGEAGAILGTTAAVAGGLGVVLGGFLGDMALRRSPNGGLYVCIASSLASVVFNLVLLTTPNLLLAFVANFLALMCAPMFIGIASSTIIGLVLPRLRALATAFYILVLTFIGLALGPYSIGLASKILQGGGMDAGEALRLACIGGSMMLVVGAVLLTLTCRFLPDDQKKVLERARTLGEEVVSRDNGGDAAEAAAPAGSTQS